MREKLIELLDDIQRFGAGYTDFELYGMRVPDEVFNDEVADHLIAHGVTIPVRCKDCKYAENMMPIGNGNGYLMGDCVLRKEDDIIVTAWEDEFCSYGEKREV